MSFIVAWLYRVLLVTEKLPKPTWINAAFYAVQTITTTGYGTDVNLKPEPVQVLSICAMAAGSMFWGIAVSVVFKALNPDR